MLRDRDCSEDDSGGGGRKRTGDFDELAGTGNR